MEETNSPELRIIVGEIPAEGKFLQGDISKELFDLSENDANPQGPLHYELTVQVFDNELLLQGILEVPFEFECVRTLKKFLKTIRLDSLALSVETKGAEEVDVAQQLREEVLLAFPAYPRCDEGDEPEECEIDLQYLAVDKMAGNGIESTPTTETGASQWEALDALDDFSDPPDEK